MLKVIVADDMEMIREGIKAMLEQLPSGAGALEIRTASSGAEAVRLMERIPADLLITDIRMPDMDGIALMERCRRLWPQTSVIVVSGYDEFKYAPEGHRVRGEGLSAQAHRQGGAFQGGRKGEG